MQISLRRFQSPLLLRGISLTCLIAEAEVVVAEVAGVAGVAGDREGSHQQAGGLGRKDLEKATKIKKQRPK